MLAKTDATWISRMEHIVQLFSKREELKGNLSKNL